MTRFGGSIIESLLRFSNNLLHVILHKTYSTEKMEEVINVFTLASGCSLVALDIFGALNLVMIVGESLAFVILP